MLALLPQGVAVAYPDQVKIVKVVSGNTQGIATFVVVLRLYDGTELVVSTLAEESKAIALADATIDAINGAIGGVYVEPLQDEDSAEMVEEYAFTREIQLKKEAKDLEDVEPKASLRGDDDDSDEWPIDDGSNEW
jgi:hypothetical protein